MSNLLGLLNSNGARLHTLQQDTHGSSDYGSDSIAGRLGAALHVRMRDRCSGCGLGWALSGMVQASASSLRCSPA
eukprot:358542-Chlamydomonas_euryale.AAC.2